MTWASKRRWQYLGGLFLFIALILFWILYPIIFSTPTCDDKKKNGSENGVDCGGQCSLICKIDTREPVVLWSRAFHITANSYNLVAFIENPNINGAVRSVSYEFRIYDDNNMLIGTKTGKTFLPANQQFVVFGPRFDAGNSKIKSVLFDFTEELSFFKKPSVINELPIYINNISFNTNDNSTSLTAVMNNESIYDLPSFDVVAIFYDKDHNAVNASKTHKDSLATNSKTNLVFTWPKGFDENPASEDLIPIINPFEAEF